FVRPAAVACLARLLGAGALPELAALADDANVMVRRAVAQALGTLTPLPEEGQALLARLLADEGVAAEARAALARHGVAPAGGARGAGARVRRRRGRGRTRRWCRPSCARRCRRRGPSCGSGRRD